MDTTIVIPTYEEALNVEPLVSAFSQCLPYGTSVLFIDDSPGPDTEYAVLAAARDARTDLTVSCIHRPAHARDGLSGAVLRGIKEADTDLVIVMDGDGQHPPETVVDLIEAAHAADLVVASRYMPGGSAAGLNGPVRHLVSRTSTYVAKGLFPWLLRGVTDPMTGFFAIKRSKLDYGLLNPTGFKILLELLLRHPELPRTQVPVRFRPREHGDSKGTVSQGFTYLKHLTRLRSTVHLQPEPGSYDHVPQFN